MYNGVVRRRTPLVMQVIMHSAVFEILSYRCRFLSTKLCWLTLMFWVPGSDLFAEQSTGGQVSQSNVRQIADWSVLSSDISMTDGSLLREYLAISEEPAGEIVNRDAPDEKSTSRLEFVFLPRFLCSPLIRVVRTHPEKIGSTDIASGVDSILLEIDNEPVPFPALIESSGNKTLYFYNVNLQRRATLRVLVELGGQMSIVYKDGESANISLAGSQKALESASTNCLTH